jgi:transcriptional regulator CtsR
MKIKDSQSQEVAMARLSDAIEQYLLMRLREAEEGWIEIQRGDLAERFGCVPSQVTYVLMTRFTPERGYLVEARRGGGGGIRITRLKLGEGNAWNLIASLDLVDQEEAAAIVFRFRQENLITDREAALILAACNRQTLGVGLPERDLIRARLLKAMLAEVLRPEEAERS